MIKDYTALALRNLKKRKLRSGLTMLGIIIAVATIFILISVSLGLKGAIEEQFRLLGADKFFIQPKGQLAGPGSPLSVQFTTRDVETIEKVAGVKDLSYWTIGNGEVKVDSQRRYVPVIGLPGEKSKVFEEMEAYEADEGRFLKEEDRGYVMIGSQYKYNNLFSNPVKTGDNILVNGQEFRVRAVLKPIGNPADDRLIYMSLEDFKVLFETGDRVDQVIVQIEVGEEISEVAERVEKKLRTARKVTEKNQDFTILTPEELLSSFGTVLNILTSFLLGVAALSLLVGSIGIATTMWTSVLERTREIGVMKAVGAKNRDILLLFLLESGFLGLIGGVIGVIFGISVSLLIEYIAANQLGTTLLQAAIPSYLIIGCLVFAFLVGSISGLWPAWRASNLKAVDALRYE